MVQHIPILQKSKQKEINKKNLKLKYYITRINHNSKCLNSLKKITIIIRERVAINMNHQCNSKIQKNLNQLQELKVKKRKKAQYLSLSKKLEKMGEVGNLMGG